MKKGQTEAFGMLVVVVLILLLITFVVGFMITRGSFANESKRVQYLANNFVNSWVGTTICEDAIVREALINCYIDPEIKSCGENSCEIATGVAQDMISGLDLNGGYSLIVFEDGFDDEPFLFLEKSGRCGEKVTSQVQQISEDVFVKLTICSN